MLEEELRKKKLDFYMMQLKIATKKIEQLNEQLFKESEEE